MHVIVGKKGTIGGSSGPSVTFNPSEGTYAGTSISVDLTVAGTGVTKLRYKNGNSDSWHTVNALTTTITVALALGGRTVTCDALDSSGTVLDEGQATYFKDSNL